MDANSDGRKDVLAKIAMPNAREVSYVVWTAPTSVQSRSLTIDASAALSLIDAASLESATAALQAKFAVDVDEKKACTTIRQVSLRGKRRGGAGAASLLMFRDALLVTPRAKLKPLTAAREDELRSLSCSKLACDKRVGFCASRSHGELRQGFWFSPNVKGALSLRGIGLYQEE